MKLTFLLAAGLFLGVVSCERHSWEETKALHKPHHHADHTEATDHPEGGHAAE